MNMIFEPNFKNDFSSLAKFVIQEIERGGKTPHGLYDEYNLPFSLNLLDNIPCSLQ